MELPRFLTERRRRWSSAAKSRVPSEFSACREGSRWCQEPTARCPATGVCLHDTSVPDMPSKHVGPEQSADLDSAKQRARCERLLSTASSEAPHEATSARRAPAEEAAWSKRRGLWQWG
eukprot:2038999-Rhodomonas_salina.1